MRAQQTYGDLRRALWQHLMTLNHRDGADYKSKNLPIPAIIFFPWLLSTTMPPVATFLEQDSNFLADRGLFRESSVNSESIGQDKLKTLAPPKQSLIMD